MKPVVLLGFAPVLLVALAHCSSTPDGSTPGSADEQTSTTTSALVQGKTLANGFGLPSVWNSTVCTAPTSTSPTTCQLADVNHDGRADLVGFNQAQGSVIVGLSNGTTFGPPLVVANQFCPTGMQCAVGDVNGDGFDDLVEFTIATRQVIVSPGGPGGFGAVKLWSSFFCQLGEVCKVADVNGDGKADSVTFTHNGTPQIYVALSNGTAFGPAQEWSGFFCQQGETCAVGDVDGDGATDVVAFSSDSSAWVSLSTKSGFSPPQRWSSNICPTGEVCTVADVNGDGVADAVAFAHGSSPQVDVALSTGSSFADSPALWDDFFCKSYETCLVGDVNGDGVADLGAVSNNSNNQLWIATATTFPKLGFFPVSVNLGGMQSGTAIDYAVNVSSSATSDCEASAAITPAADIPAYLWTVKGMTSYSANGTVAQTVTGGGPVVLHAGGMVQVEVRAYPGFADDGIYATTLVISGCGTPAATIPISTGPVTILGPGPILIATSPSNIARDVTTVNNNTPLTFPVHVANIGQAPATFTWSLYRAPSCVTADLSPMGVQTLAPGAAEDLTATIDVGQCASTTDVLLNVIWQILGQNVPSFNTFFDTQLYVRGTPLPPCVRQGSKVNGGTCCAPYEPINGYCDTPDDLHCGEYNTFPARPCCRHKQACNAGLYCFTDGTCAKGGGGPTGTCDGTPGDAFCSCIQASNLATYSCNSGNVCAGVNCLPCGGANELPCK